MAIRDSKVLQQLHPAWFGVVLSSAGAALVLLLDPLANQSADEWAGIALVIVSSLVWLTLVAAFGLRQLHFAADLVADLKHASFGPLFAAAPAGTLVLSAAIGQLARRELIAGDLGRMAAAALLVIGTVATLIVGMFFFKWVVDNAELAVPAITGAWFIPVVPLVLVPSGLIRVVAPASAAEWSGWAFLAAAVWGAGIVLWLLLAAVVGYRLITLPSPPAHAAATWWIWLAPMGAGGLGLLATTTMASQSSLGLDWLASLGALGATVFWGFGIWWAVFAAVKVWSIRADLHFHVGYWGFVFPSAAMAGLTLELGHKWQLPALEATGSTFVLATALLWAVFAVKTMRQIASKQAFNRA